MIVRRLRAFFLPEPGRVRPAPYALIAVVGIVVGLTLAGGPIGQRLEWQVYDQYVSRQAASRDPAPGVVVVAIDEVSFSHVGMAWPWPRSMHAALIDALVAGGARSITFDILFDVPAANAADDAALAASMARAGNVILGAELSLTEDRRYTVAQWTAPIEPLTRVARAVGAVNIPYDPDGVLRRARPEWDGRPSLALAVAAQQPGFAMAADVERSAPRLFRFARPPRRGVVTVSYYQALDAASALPADIFRDKHVLVGRALAATTIDATVDHFRTPVSVQMPGVEVHAAIVDALLRDGSIRDPLASVAAYAALCAFAGAIISALLFFTGPAAGAALLTGLTALLLAASYASLARGVHLPVADPSLAMATAFVSTSAYRVALASRERRLIKGAFQHYVAPAIVERMLSDPAKLKLGGEHYDVTVLFSDLESFTTLGERLTPAQLGAHLGEYLQEMLDVLLPQHGTLDKLIGDSIMMYFGCPVPDPEHPVQACRGALAMQRRMAALNDRWARASLPRLRTRIGINSGAVVAGNMGTTTIFNYTILGDCVNLASRLEGVNKEYSTSILVGEDTWTRVHGLFVGRELDAIRVKGRSAPVAIYELAGESGNCDHRLDELFERFGEGLQLYRGQRWSDAAAVFQQALAVDPRDGPSRRFMERCASYQRQPPVDWDGVHAM